ncbi:MAG TPA: ribosome rescue protein RqcH [Candidatus Bathyarchaeia archaeon]|nr:ribosome rescue protein RqcH [Candidatus Bathyarchaeia archaeon]
MKQVMTSVDVAALLPEMDVLVGARLEKAYQLSPTEIRLRLATREGKYDLVVEAGKRLHLANNPALAPPVPPSFPMLLRKELKGGRITKIAQYDFDRIVEIQFSRGEDQRYLVCELFSKGNVILTDASKRIILPLRGVRSAARPILRGQDYEYPATQLNPLEVSRDALERALVSSSRDVVRTLATQFNLGGLYAEEVCLKARVAKDKTAVTKEESLALCEALSAIFDPIRSGKLTPHIVCEDKSPVDVLPFELSQYEKCEKRYFASFNRALDVYYGLRIEPRETTPATQARLQKIIERQQAAIQQFKRLERENHLKGDLLFEKYREVDRLISAVREARKSRTWDDVSHVLSSLSFVEGIDQRAGIVTIRVDGLLLDVVVDEDVPQNAEKYYEKAKLMKAKSEGAQRALELSISKIDKEKASVERQLGSHKLRPKKKKPRWYERFRWFFSTDGFLVIGGRDAETNEEIVKKYLEPRDLFFHADVHGAPAVIVKSQGKEIPESTLREVAQFAVAYSSVWREGFDSGRCYWVYPSQVSKTPESGEYVPKGAFIIRGERHYMEAHARVAVGVQDDRVVGGPVSAITHATQLAVVLAPGKYNLSDAAKMVLRELLAKVPEQDKKRIRALVAVDQITRFLPPGYSEISGF